MNNLCSTKFVQAPSNKNQPIRLLYFRLNIFLVFQLGRFQDFFFHLFCRHYIFLLSSTLRPLPWKLVRLTLLNKFSAKPRLQLYAKICIVEIFVSKIIRILVSLRQMDCTYIYGLLTTREVKMAGYWPNSLWLWIERSRGP